MKQSKIASRTREIVREIRRLARPKTEANPDGLGRTPNKGEALMSGKILEWEMRKFFGSYLELCAIAKLDPPPAAPKPVTPERKPINPDTEAKLNLKINRLKQDNAQLALVLREMEKKVLGDELIRKLLGSLDANVTDRGPEWLTPEKGMPGTFGTPLLLISDWHLDEVVDQAEINGCNQYNRRIAVERMKRTFEKTITLLKKHLVAPKYDGIVIAVGGDMFSGDIHEELSDTNEGYINESMLIASDTLVPCIARMADEFGKVFVPWVVGNHPRQSKKPRAKGRVKDNFEWLLGQYVARELKHDKRITFNIPTSADCSFEIYKKRFLLTHGDQFQGGTGIAGLYSPLMLGIARKQKRQMAIGQPFDVVMMGHWHQYIHAQNLIVNGSVKGYDEYAFVSNLPFEEPQQALFIVRPDGKITFRMPVFCDG